MAMASSSSDGTSSPVVVIGSGTNFVTVDLTGNDDPADVLFTELAPGSDMDGATLASRATARVPGLGVVFSASRGAPRGDTGHPVVTKPYGRKELAAALTEAVEGRATHGRA